MTRSALRIASSALTSLAFTLLAIIAVVGTSAVTSAAAAAAQVPACDGPYYVLINPCSNGENFCNMFNFRSDCTLGTFIAPVAPGVGVLVTACACIIPVQQVPPINPGD